MQTLPNERKNENKIKNHQQVLTPISTIDSHKKKKKQEIPYFGQIQKNYKKYTNGLEILSPAVIFRLILNRHRGRHFLFFVLMLNEIGPEPSLSKWSRSRVKTSGHTDG
jgi:hypothetical protein